MQRANVSAPLSEDVEARRQETWNRVLAWREGSPSEPSLDAILRAFAREILADCLAEHPPEQAYLDWPAEEARLEESARTLAEALEKVTEHMDRAGGDGDGMPECPWCRRGPDGDEHTADCELALARGILGAYRDSGRGRV